MRAVGCVVLVCLAATLVGCRTTSSGAGGQAKSKPGKIWKGDPAESDLYPDADGEQRIEAQTRFAVGLLHELNQDPDAALEEFYLSALSDPSHEALVFDVAGRLLQRQDADRAIKLLTAATAVPDCSGIAHAYLGLAYAQAGKKELAIEASRQGLQKMPRSLQAYQNLIQLYVENEQPGEAIEILDDALRQPDADAWFLVNLAELFTGYSQVKKLDAAVVKPKVIALLDRAAGLQPDDAALNEKLADGYKLLGELAKATALFEQLVADHPGALGLRLKLAELYLRTDDRRRAMEQWEAIVRENPTNPTAYFFLGNLAQDQKDFAKAEACFEKLLLLNDGNEQAYQELALTQINLDKPDAAVATLEKASARFPASFVTEFYLALAQARARRYDESLKHFSRAEFLAETGDTTLLNHVFYFQYGSAYERSGQYAAAEKTFKKCLELSPDFAEALNYLGYMWAERGEHLEEARDLIERALKLQPENAAYLDSMGWVLFKLNRPHEALDYLLNAVAHAEKPDPTLLDHLGDIYAQLGQPQKARDAWQQSLALETNEAIQAKLAAGLADRGAVPLPGPASGTTTNRTER